MLARLSYPRKKRLSHRCDELASVLGVRRAGISLTVARLRRAGAITSVRGGVVVADYDRLLEESCECYGLMREAIRLEWTPGP